MRPPSSRLACRRASRSGKSGRQEVGDAAIEVILQFAIEAALQAAAPEPVEQLLHDAAALVEDQTDGARQPLPTVLFHGELFAAGAGQRVELRLAAGFRLFPFGLQPPLLFQPVERRIERSLVDLDHRAGDLLQPLRDAVAVRGLEREDLQNQHVERALGDGKTGRRHRIPQASTVQHTAR